VRFLQTIGVARRVAFCGLMLFAAAGIAFGAEAPVEPPSAVPVQPPEPVPPKPPVPVNLISNPDFETDKDADGVPDGWFHSEPEYWCGPEKGTPHWNQLRELWVQKGTVPANIPFRPAGTLEGGIYGWESPGDGGGHSVSIDEVSEQKWGEWDTVVKGIKPGTDYVITGWRKQSAPASRQSAPWMQIGAFGTLTPVKGTVDRDTWVPFAITVNSGSFEGQCRIGFIVDQAPTKVWLDRVAMFEGTMNDVARFRTGLKGAALEYPFHDTVYASPDLECPLFFDILWSLHGLNGERNLEIAIDLPVGLDLTGGASGMGLELGEPAAQPISIEGRPYIRRTFTVLTARTIREFESAGTRSLRLWLNAAPEPGAGVFEAYYHARWPGGRQPNQVLKIKIVRFGEVKRPRPLLAAIGGVPSDLAASRVNKLIKGLPATGVNCLVLDGKPDPTTAGLFEKAGIAVAGWFSLGGGNLPQDAVARDAAGNAIPGRLCPSYRSDDAMDTVFAGPAALVADGVTVLFTDLRDTGHGVCFCERCRAEFEAFARMRHPELEGAVKPEDVADPEKREALADAWAEFRSAKLADLYWTLRKGLDAFRKRSSDPLPNATIPLKVLAMVPSPGAGRSDAVDYGRMAGVFDVEIIDPMMNRADLGGTPAWVGGQVAELIKLLPPGGKAGVAVTAGATDDGAAMAPLVVHSDVRDQVLEAVAAGAKAVILHPFYAVDGMNLKQFSEALSLLAPFEEIIAEGEPAGLVAVSAGTASARCLARDGSMLLLVSDYSEAPAEDVLLDLTFPEGAERVPMVLIDAESASVVAEVPADAKTVTVSLHCSRARLFYLGPLSKSPIPVPE